jgi:hypothetical protein
MAILINASHQQLNFTVDLLHLLAGGAEMLRMCARLISLNSFKREQGKMDRGLAHRASVLPHINGISFVSRPNQDCFFTIRRKNAHTTLGSKCHVTNVMFCGLSITQLVRFLMAELAHHSLSSRLGASARIFLNLIQNLIDVVLATCPSIARHQW